MILSPLMALAEPTRLAAVSILWDGSEHCVCELMKRLDATQSRMSRHMQTLKQAGLVVDRRDAQWVRYRLNPDMRPEVRNVLAAVMAATDAAEIKNAA
ncbi:MAG TPA: metalloregulator ArsR/SmtB family transcription factor [Rhizobium sp.]|nr:metalloregulator ArsR/SmtB family transcription factor [Rhizobium sp.]